jgi:tetratricopeptide (TPR) repeat protein
MLVGLMALTFGAARGEFAAAMELAARSMKVAEEFGAPNLLAAARAGLGLAHALRGEWHEAARFLEETIALVNERQTLLEGEGMALVALADVYINIGEAERAKKTAERGVTVARERARRSRSSRTWWHSREPRSPSATTTPSIRSWRARRR